MEIINLSVLKIKPDPTQPRQTLDTEKIKGMAESMITEGVINPIEIDKNYFIVTGEMRWRAAKAAGLKTIPCRIIESIGIDRYRRQVVENIHHNTMTDWDTAKALEKLLDYYKNDSRVKAPHDKGYAYLGKMLGIRHQIVYKYISILGDSKEIQDNIKAGKINASWAEEIRPVDNRWKSKLLKKILNEEFKTRDDAREVIRALKRSPNLGDKILAAKSIKEVFQISPPIAYQIRESYNPVNELSGIVDQLVDWVKRNPPDAVGRVHAARIIFNLNGAVNAANAWGHNALTAGTKQLKESDNGN